MNHLSLSIKQFEPLKHFSANMCVGKRAATAEGGFPPAGGSFVKWSAVHLSSRKLSTYQAVRCSLIKWNAVHYG
ncbi:MAG: hypothetical protein K2N13_04910 [Paraprevotella sp.]|nr:hypothetical protein [Paraprevotella sp.]